MLSEGICLLTNMWDFISVFFCHLPACLCMEGCSAVEREVDRVLTKFNTTQQVRIDGRNTGDAMNLKAKYN